MWTVIIIFYIWFFLSWLMFLAYPEFYVFYYLSSKTDFYEYFVKRNKKLLYLKRTKLKKIQDYIFIGGIFISVGIFCGGGVNWILGPALKLIEKDPDMRFSIVLMIGFILGSCITLDIIPKFIKWRRTEKIIQLDRNLDERITQLDKELTGLY